MDETNTTVDADGSTDEHADSGIDLSRRTVLQGIGAAGLLGIAGTQNAAAAPSVTSVGEAGYADGVPSHVDASPPSPQYTTSNVSAPYPTNDWWSRLLTVEHAESLFSHPIFTEPTTSGLEIGYTEEWDVGDGSGVNMDGNPVTQYMDMDDTPYMPIEPDFTIGHTATTSFDQSLVDGFGDWHVTYQMGSSDPSMTVTQVQGSPYLYLDYAGGGAELSFPSTPTVFEDRGNAIGVTIDGHHYGLFGPESTSWSGTGSATLSNGLGSDGYATIALLPDDTSSTFDTFEQYAHNHVTGTQIDWEYVNVEGGQPVSEVRTTFDFTVTDRSGSGSTGTIAALYPHQHKYLHDGESTLAGVSYESPRGTMKLSQGSSFTTALPYTGILPNYPVMDSIADTEQLYEYAVGISTPDTSSDQFDGSLSDKHGVPTLSETDVVDWSRLPYNAGKSSPYGSTYWTGLNYNRWSEAAALLNELGETSRRDLVLDFMKGSYEQWFTPKGDLDFGEDEFDTNMFFYDNEWGSLTGHVGGFNSYAELNDHHFHYGYYVKGASEIARYGDSWTDESNWGGMIKLLIQEFANPTRGDDMFPFLRNFSPYSGHSWASGVNPFDLGNNQEASSEAIDAYAGLIRWGAFTGQEIDGTSIEELGIFLYTHEIHAALEYWYDWDQENHPDAWDREYASVVWGDGYSHSTWWTERAEDTYAINVIPANGDSLYLGWDDSHAGTVYDELVSIKGDENYSYWPGILTEYEGFSDPSAALTRFQDWEAGNYPGAGSYYVPDMSNSKLHTYSMLKALEELGSPTRDVVSNGTFSHVFVDDTGQKNYVAYNPSDAEQLICFSDGTGISVAPNSLAVEYGSNSQGCSIDSTPPEPPADLAVTSTTDTTASLSWTESTSSDLLHYNVYESGTKVAEATGSSTTVSGLESAAELSFTLTAVDDAYNESTESAGPVNATTAVNSEDYTQDARATDTDTQSWTFTPAHTAGSVDLTYSVNGGSQTSVAMSDGNGDGEWTASATGFADGDAIDYYYTFEKGGSYYDTTTFSITFDYTPDTTAPSVPANLSSPGQTTSSIDLSWDASSDSGGSGLDHYVVYVDDAEDQTVAAGTTTATVSGLTAETSYAIDVTAVDAAGNESGAATLTVSTASESGDTVSGSNWTATLTEPSDSELTFEFDHDADANWADLHYTVNDGSQLNVGMTAQSGSHTYTVTGLSADDVVDYYFTYEEDGLAYDTSNYTYTFVGSGGGGGDETAPTEPANLSSPSHDSSSVDLDWDASSDTGGSGLDHYVVYVDGTQDQTVSAGSTSATVSGLSMDTAYDCSVTAVDGAGNESTAAGSISVTTDGDTTAPSSPSNLTSPAHDSSSIDIDWDAASDTGGSGLDHYVVYVDGATDHTVPAGTTTATVDGLAMSTSYDLSVSAVDGAGNESTAAGPISVTTDGDTTDPTVPSNLSSPAHTDTSVDLDWDAASDSGSGIDHYNVYEGSTKQREATTTSATVSGLSAETQYTFTVTAVDGYGNESSESNSVTVTTDADSGSGDQVSGSDWVATLTETSSSELEFEFDRDPDSDWVDVHYTINDGGQLNYRMTDQGSFHTHVVSGLADGDTLDYYFTYEEGGLAYDTSSFTYEFGGSGGTSDTTAPSAPSNLSSPSHSDSAIDLDWDAASDTGGSGLDHYAVYVDGVEDQTVAAGTTGATVSGLTAGTSYDFSVSAVDGAGNESAAAGPITVTTDSSGGSGDTVSGDGWTATLTEPSSGELTIEFDHDSDSTWVDLHYIVDSGAQQNVRMNAGTSSHTYTITGLSAGDLIDYSFTYEEGGLAYGSSDYSYTMG